MQVCVYDISGETQRKKNLVSRLKVEPNTQIPNDLVTWNGREITYLPSKQKRKIMNWKLGDSTKD